MHGKKTDIKVPRNTKCWGRVSVAIDGQCGSTGNNAWRCTVSSTDFQTNSVLHFRVIDVFVSNDVLIVFSLRNYSSKKLH